MKLTTRELALLAVFGGLWGLVEISLGSVLKSLNVPFSGAFLAATGLTVALSGRYFVPSRGSILFIAVIATLLKLFSLGGVILGPIVGIMAEALVAEGVLLFFKKPGSIAFSAAGGFAVVWAFLQPLVTGPVLFGRELAVVWLDLLVRGSRLIGLESYAVTWIVVTLLAIHFVMGSLAGLAGWDIAHRIQQRLGKSFSEAVGPFG